MLLKKYQEYKIHIHKNNTINNATEKFPTDPFHLFWYIITILSFVNNSPTYVTQLRRNLSFNKKFTQF